MAAIERGLMFYETTWRAEKYIMMIKEYMNKLIELRSITYGMKDFAGTQNA